MLLPPPEWKEASLCVVKPSVFVQQTRRQPSHSFVSSSPLCFPLFFFFTCEFCLFADRCVFSRFIVCRVSCSFIPSFCLFGSSFQSVSLVIYLISALPVIPFSRIIMSQLKQEEEDEVPVWNDPLDSNDDDKSNGHPSVSVCKKKVPTKDSSSSSSQPHSRRPRVPPSRLSLSCRRSTTPTATTTLGQECRLLWRNHCRRRQRQRQRRKVAGSFWQQHYSYWCSVSRPLLLHRWSLRSLPPRQRSPQGKAPGGQPSSSSSSPPRLLKSCLRQPSSNTVSTAPMSTKDDNQQQQQDPCYSSSESSLAPSRPVSPFSTTSSSSSSSSSDDASQHPTTTSEDGVNGQLVRLVHPGWGWSSSALAVLSWSRRRRSNQGRPSGTTTMTGTNTCWWLL